MKQKLLELFIFLLVIAGLTACQIQRQSAEVISTSTFEPAATQEMLQWVTIAPDSIVPPTATPTSPPLEIQPVGQIAFQTERDGNFEIYIASADGTRLNRITNNPAVDVFPAWSPDGKQLVFSSDRNGDPDIYIVNVDGSGLKQITEQEGDDALPAWSPDGSRIAFSSNRDGDDEIYVMDRNGGNVKQLTNNSDMDVFPAWSPDGERIVFSSNRDVNFEIYVMNLDGSNLRRLTEDAGMDANPAWSPDGLQIAFISNRDGYSNLYLMENDGGNVRQLTTRKATVEKPSWSADGQMIAFASNMSGNRDIFITGVNGIGLRQLTDATVEDFYPAWEQTGSITVNVVSTPTLPAQYACRVSTDPAYGTSTANPIQLGYDPRLLGADEEKCLTWLTGPQGQVIRTQLLEELDIDNTRICKVAVSFEGLDEPAILYFDLYNYRQPLAPVGFACGSEVEYSRAIAAALQAR